HVGGIRGAPEGRRAAFVHAGQVEVVAGIPDLLLQTYVRVGALVEQRLHQIEIGRLLLLVRARLRVQRLRRPLAVDRGIERRHAVLGGDRRIRALVEQVLRDVEVPVDRRDQNRARVVARAHLVHVGAGLDERFHRRHLALPRREQERRQAALGADELIVEVLAIDAADVGTAAPAAAAAAGGRRGTGRSTGAARWRRRLRRSGGRLRGLLSRRRLLLR